MATTEYYILKRESTEMKIDLAFKALLEAYKHNKAKWAWPKPVRPRTSRRTPKVMHGVKGMDTVVYSNKQLCGILGSLCQQLRAAGIPYPWMD